MSDLKFQRGETVHTVIPHKGRFVVCSVEIESCYTGVDEKTTYKLHGYIGEFYESDLHATFDNAFAELQRQNKANK